MTFPRYAIFLSLISSSVLAQTWVQISDNNKALNCPDMLELDEHAYVIRNECYGKNEEEYILETGLFLIQEKTMVLKQRQIHSRSFIQGVSKTVVLNSHFSTSGEMRLEHRNNRYYFLAVD